MAVGVDKARGGEEGERGEEDEKGVLEGKCP